MGHAKDKSVICGSGLGDKGFLRYAQSIALHRTPGAGKELIEPRGSGLQGETGAQQKEGEQINPSGYGCVVRLVPAPSPAYGDRLNLNSVTLA
jgi:hypothetical protein